MDWKQRVKDYFSFSRRERRGILALLVILVGLLLAPLLFPLFISSDPVDHSAFEAAILAFERSIDSASAVATADSIAADDAAMMPVAAEEPFPFNPNNLPEEEWQALGINKKVIRTIKNYESKGGRFYKKEDLQKIYGLKESDYQRLAPYIRLDTAQHAHTFQAFKKDTFQFSGWDSTRSKPFTPRMVALNTADTTELMALRGVGPYFARKIFRYREALGGFRTKQQLLEIWGMDTARFAKLLPQLQLDTAQIRMLNVNDADYEQLKKHPYLSPQVASSIVNYRQQHGPFEALDGLKAIYSIDEALFQKIEPYLTLQ